MPLSPLEAQGLSSGQPNNIGMAMQMHAWAQVQSAYYMAQSRPRMVAACRQKMLDECKDFRFACEAVWAKPVGRDVKKGLGIRFAEAAALCWTNLKVESTNICETDELRILRTTVTDLESNVSHTRDTAVEKYVIRKAPPKLAGGQRAQVWSCNTRGEAQYRVRATADDMLMMQGKELSKAERLLILKHIPKHIQDDCKRALHETLQGKASRGDRKFILALIDQFAEIKVSARQLESYLGHDPEALTGIEITMLNGLFYDIADERTTFAEAMAERHGERVEPAPARRVGAGRRVAGGEDGDREMQDAVVWARRQDAGAQGAVEADDDAELTAMDLESLDNLGEDPSERPAPAARAESARFEDDGRPSAGQRALRALPAQPGRGR